MTRKPPPVFKGPRKGGRAEFAYSVCAAVKNSMPDMYNSPPKRVVSIEEAKAHGWPCFFDGISPCTQGHVAARYVSNPARCVDCARIYDGKLPIYGKPANADLIGDLVEAPQPVNPALRTDFRWTDEVFRQFGVAYINKGSVEAALTLVNAQPYDLIQELRNNPERAAEFDALRRDVDQVFLWKAEGNAATGSDRAMLARAGATFPDRFGSRSQSGLDTQPYVNPDKACAELAQLLSNSREQIAQRNALGAPRTAGKPVAGPNPGAAADAAGDVEAPVLLGPPHDNSDLI